MYVSGSLGAGMKFIRFSAKACFVLLTMSFVSEHSFSQEEVFNSLGLGVPQKWRPLKDSKFLGPRERDPKLLKPFVKHSNGGLYMSVGTERGLMGAVLSGADRLLLLDIDPNAVMYNRVNIALLKASKAGDRNHYLHLRLHATIDEIAQAALAATDLDPESKRLLTDPAIMRGFRATFKDPDNRPHFARFHRPPSSDVGTFKEANYLFDDELFNKVQSLAKRGRIEAFRGDWRAKETMKRIASLIRDRKMPIGVIDFSNAWQRGYISPAQMARVLKDFSEVGQKETLFLYSGLTPKGDNVYIRYFALSNDYVSKHGEEASRDFFRVMQYTSYDRKYMPTDFFDRINGHPVSVDFRSVRMADKPYDAFARLALDSDTAGLISFEAMSLDPSGSITPTWWETASPCAVVQLIVDHEQRLLDELRAVAKTLKKK